MKAALLVLAGVLGGFTLAGTLFFVANAPLGEAITLLPAPTEEPIAVHVLGAVARPGLYLLPDRARVQDAINAAGGVLAEADVNTLNLAARLEDGQRLAIPYAVGQEPALLPNQEATPAATDLAAGDLININTATLDQLDSLPGIGPTTAEKIIAYREENGPFSQIEDLMDVAGIGPAAFEEIRGLITV